MKHMGKIYKRIEKIKQTNKKMEENETTKIQKSKRNRFCEAQS